MKIVFLSDDFPPISYGGAGISTFELALGMKKAGQEVYVITTCPRQEDVGETKYQGLKVFRIKSDYEERWRACRSLYNRPVVKQVKELLEKIKHFCKQEIFLGNIAIPRAWLTRCVGWPG